MPAYSVSQYRGRGDRAPLDALGGGLGGGEGDDPLDEDPGEVDPVGVDGAGFDQFPRPRRTVIRPAIAASGLKLRAEAWKTRLPCRSPLAARTSAKSVRMAALQDVRDAVELPHLLRRGGERDPALAVVAPGQSAVGDLGADASGGVEGG
ncbi:hypothetical protein GCM10019017_04130 [Streptomyces showdoensis]